jgi:hypothetical protein
MRCVYVICEKEKTSIKLTSKKNKCNALYVGESKNFEERKKAYIRKDNNELRYKLWKYLFPKSKHSLLEKIVLTEHIKFRTIQSPNFQNDDYRKEVEGYLIERLSPLLNKSKREGKFERTFKKFEISSLTWDDYKNDYDEVFWNWYWHRTDIGDTETIFHCKLRRYVPRDSDLGEEAENINYSKKHNSWKWKNELHLKFDLWRTDGGEWRKGLKF